MSIYKTDASLIRAYYKIIKIENDVNRNKHLNILMIEVNLRGLSIQYLISEYPEERL